MEKVIKQVINNENDVEMHCIKDDVVCEFSIRRATEWDLPEIINLIYLFFIESISDYGLTLSMPTIKDVATSHVKNNIVFVAVKEQRIIGCISGLLQPSMFNENQLVGQELMWYVSKDERKGVAGQKLILRFENECILRGASLIIMGSMGNIYTNVLDKFYKRRNYKILETHYIKEA